MDEPSKQPDKIFCLECAKPIKRKASFCANCGTKIKNLDNASPTKADYNIGDTSPAGGFIFYINPNYANYGYRYLEVATNDLPFIDNEPGEIPWNNGNYTETGATGTAIGTGRPNTQKIVKIQGSGSYSAKLCDDLKLNGYSDWFMPSKDEVVYAQWRLICFQMI